MVYLPASVLCMLTEADQVSKCALWR